MRSAGPMVAALVLLTSVGAPALATPTPAQPAPADPAPTTRVPLDTGRERVAAVRVESTTYRVYRYENRLSYAGGVEIHADGRVTDRARAREVAGALAWRRAARGLDREDVRQLRSIRDRLRRVNRTLAPAARGIDAVFVVRERLRDVQVRGVDVWTVASTASVVLPVLMTTLERLRADIRSVRRVSGDTADEIDATLAAVERLRAGETVDYDRLNRTVANASEGLATVERRAANLSAGLSDAAGMAESAVNQTRSVPAAGEPLSRALSPAARDLRTAAEDLDRFADRVRRQRDRLRTFRRTARAEERATLRSWRARQQATERVYGTGVGLAALLLGGAVVARRRGRIAAAVRAAPREGGALDVAALRTALLDPPDPHAGGPPYCPACGLDLLDHDHPSRCPRCDADLDERR